MKFILILLIATQAKVVITRDLHEHLEVRYPESANAVVSPHGQVTTTATASYDGGDRVKPKYDPAPRHDR